MGCLSLPLSLCWVAHRLTMSPEHSFYQVALSTELPSPGFGDTHFCPRSPKTIPSLGLSLNPDHTFVKHPCVKLPIDDPPVPAVLSLRGP